MSTNKEEQRDEVEALTAIMGSAFITTHSDTVFDIHFRQQAVRLHITYPIEYPSDSSPSWTLIASCMNSEDNTRLHSTLNDICERNLGFPVVYTLVQAVEDFLLDRYPDQPPPDCQPEELPPPEKPEPEQDCPGSYTTETEQLVAAARAEIVTGPTIEDRKSVFQGHFSKVCGQHEVNLVLEQLKTNRKIRNATHNMWACRIRNEKGFFIRDCDDDGENYAGMRLLHLLDILHADQHLVVVSRWFGGTRLGPDRFKHINNVARQVMEMAGAIPDKVEHAKFRRTNKKP